MCGIVGFLAPSGFTTASALPAIEAMSASVAHRGPDADGIWLEPSAGIALAHRRLSILDLSPAGNQPMISCSGRYVIVFNGEIYNHTDLRRSLGGVHWRGHSDTETLLAAISHWGVETALRRAVGMFAFALWDTKLRELVLARDRLGEKPLYYGWQAKGNEAVLVFGSELAALRKHPAFEGNVDRNALCLLLRHSYIPAPYSIFGGVWKLRPGHFLTFTARAISQHATPESRAYWSLRDVIGGDGNQSSSMSEREAVCELERLLRDAVSRQSLADVPIGAFLSGGIDSSLIVALMQAQSTRPVRTFTIGFAEGTFNEAEFAKSVASHLGTEHTELYVSARDALDVIPKLPSIYSEPFSDSSQIPTYLVSALTRAHVTVALSGDAGDELFGGYTRYLTAGRWWKRVGRIPRLVRECIGSASYLRAFGGAYGRFRRVAKFHSLVRSTGCGSMYRHFVSHWDPPETVVLGGLEPVTVFSDLVFARSEPVEEMMALDTISYLPDDILTKVDRAAMAVGLETRVPFLDHRVVEFAWRVPFSMKLRDGTGKWILRRLLENYVPNSLFERPKMGFGIPINAWLRGPLRDWAESLLDETRLENEGFLRSGPIRRVWKEHLSGEFDWQYHLWDVLMFQAWIDAQRG